MPLTFFAFVCQTSAWSQVKISLLAIAVFVLNTAPLEMQRRILNAAIIDRNAGVVVALAVAYVCIVVSEGLLKLFMHVWRLDRRKIGACSATRCEQGGR